MGSTLSSRLKNQFGVLTHEVSNFYKQPVIKNDTSRKDPREWELLFIGWCILYEMCFINRSHMPGPG
jgi:hypothetical protein